MEEDCVLLAIATLLVGLATNPSEVVIKIKNKAKGLAYS